MSLGIENTGFEVHRDFIVKYKVKVPRVGVRVGFGVRVGIRVRGGLLESFSNEEALHVILDVVLTVINVIHGTISTVTYNYG